MHDIRKQKLVEKGDKVLLGLSGGKDSVMALEILNNLRERHIIDLVAVTIDEGIAGYRQEGVEIATRNAEKLGVEHRIVSFKECFGFTLDEIMCSTTHTNSCGPVTDEKGIIPNIIIYNWIFPGFCSCDGADGCVHSCSKPLPTLLQDGCSITHNPPRSSSDLQQKYF